MKNREIFLGLVYHTFRHTEIKFYSGIDIFWPEIERRCKYLDAGTPCTTTAFILRDYLESERQVDPSRLCFEAVVGDNDALWHVWLEKEGQVVDTETFKKMYRRMYPLGRPLEILEQQYRSMKRIGAFEAF